MSQIYASATGSTPSIPTNFVTDDGTAIPAANTLNINGVDSSEDNINGILARANPNGGDTVEIVLTNRLQGSATTIGAVTGDIITFDLGASAAVYRFEIKAVGRDTTTGDGATYSVLGAIKTDGATATEISVDTQNENEDASLVGASIDLLASGNNAVLRVTGVAGQTISFAAVGYYVVI